MDTWAYPLGIGRAGRDVAAVDVAVQHRGQADEHGLLVRTQRRGGVEGERGGFPGGPFAHGVRMRLGVRTATLDGCTVFLFLKLCYQ